MEVRKSSNLPSTSWRTRRADGVIHSKSKDLRTREANGRNSSLSPGAWKSVRGVCQWCKSWSELSGLRTRSTRVGRQKVDVPCRELIHPSSFFLLCSGPLTDAHWHWGGRSSLLSPLIQILISSGSTLTDTPRSKVSPAVRESLSPVKLPCKSNHHTFSADVFTMLQKKVGVNSHSFPLLHLQTYQRL